MARMTRELHLTGDDAADKLLSDDPVALLVGMLIDQQVPVLWKSCTSSSEVSPEPVSRL